MARGQPDWRPTALIGCKSCAGGRQVSRGLGGRSSRQMMAVCTAVHEPGVGLSADYKGVSNKEEKYLSLAIG